MHRAMLNGTHYAVTVDYFSYFEEKLGRWKRFQQKGEVVTLYAPSPTIPDLRQNRGLRDTACLRFSPHFQSLKYWSRGPQ
jgi:hypothetical protein